MKKIWPVIYLVLIPVTILGGYRELSPEATARTNADWIFVSITFITCVFFPIGAVTFGFKYSGKAFMQRPTWDRHPMGWWTDTLQSLRLMLVYAALAALGAAFAFPHADKKGQMVFVFLLAMPVGLFIGERLVYAVYRKRIKN